MDPLVQHRLSALATGPEQHFENLTLTPLFDASPGRLAYRTLGQALASGALRVMEVGVGGSVPKLTAINDSDWLVLLLDGEELEGAKQNRVLNTSILLAPRSKTVIPVSCTECGRWRYTAPRFSDSGNVMPASQRRGKSADVTDSLRVRRAYDSDQSAVWDRVERMHRRLDVTSSTRAMADAFRARGPELDAYLAAFERLPGQKGLAVTIGGALLGLDFVSLEAAFAELYPKLLKSYAMEALMSPAGPAAPPSPSPLEARLKALARSTESRHASVGCGTDLRYSGEGVVGSALVHADEVVHLACFWGDESPGADWMTRASERRRFRRG